MLLMSKLQNLKHSKCDLNRSIGLLGNPLIIEMIKVLI